jgi:hypothetical protein
MTALNLSGRRPAKRASIETDTARPQFMLTADGEQWLHEAGQTLTYNRAFAWRGNRDQMRTIIEGVPEGLRKRLHVRLQSAPRAARRA